MRTLHFFILVMFMSYPGVRAQSIDNEVLLTIDDRKDAYA